jgi:ssDNA thymidine ADP-ribosyltransferase, DarT
VLQCHLAIYLAHTQKSWVRSDLIDISATKAEVNVPPSKPWKRAKETNTAVLHESNMDVLQRNGISALYHFTDAANLPSIREHGLMSASSLLAKDMTVVMNSDELSRNLDKDLGIENYVRLSFNDQNPMRYVAKKDGRISHPVILQVKLEVVSRAGVLFSDCNATRREAIAVPRCSPLQRCESLKSVCSAP